jgi:hypothetical protein
MIQFLTVISKYFTALVSDHQYQVSDRIVLESICLILADAKPSMLTQHNVLLSVIAGTTKGGSITVPLTSYLTCLELAV